MRADWGAYGLPVHTPHLDELAKDSLLFTHAFCLYLALLGTGQRMGARAVEALPVRQNGALALYTAYPERVGNPLVTLKAAVDGADGGAPDEAAREALMQELPAAIQRASLMLAPLAVTA